MSLGPRKSCNLLVKYLSFDAQPKIYLIRFTKLVDKYDLGRSFQIKVNHDRQDILLSNSSQPEHFRLAPEKTIYVSYDKTKPLKVKHENGEMFTEHTKVSP